MTETEVEIKNSDLAKKLDLTDLVAANKLGGFENVSVNTDNSKDVIIGPVTQFNVNGNVTILQRETDLAKEDDRSLHDDSDSEEVNSEMLSCIRCDKTSQKTEKVQDNPLKCLIRNKKITTSIVSVICIVTVSVVIIILKHNKECKNCYNQTSSRLGEAYIINRHNWQGREPRGTVKILPPVDTVIIKHTGGTTCSHLQICSGKIVTIQSTNMANGFSDIYCNFLIGGDGNIYVGRGWNVRNHQRDGTIDIVFIGNFDIDPFSEIMATAAKLLIEDGARRKKLASNYRIISHNQTTNTRSPGKNVFEEIVTWKHYDDGLYLNYVIFGLSQGNPSVLWTND